MVKKSQLDLQLQQIMEKSLEMKGRLEIKEHHSVAERANIGRKVFIESEREREKIQTEASGRVQSREKRECKLDMALGYKEAREWERLVEIATDREHGENPRELSSGQCKRVGQGGLGQDTQQSLFGAE